MHVRATVLTALTTLAPSPAWAQPAPPPEFRAPAVPLVVCNPYFSAWARSDRLTDNWPRHWSGSVMGMAGLVRIDGKAYRWCGPLPQDVPPLAQSSVRFTATSTTYEFDAGGVRLSVEFLSPTLATDPDLASRAVTFVTAGAKATDGREHDVGVYLDVTGEWCTHEPSQAVTWGRAKLGDLSVLRMGTVSQAACERAGDHTRIDWGTMNVVSPATGNRSTVIAGHDTCRRAFAERGELPGSDDLRMPRAAQDDWPVLALATSLGRVGGEWREAECMLAYDEGVCIEYFGRKLRPYWARSGKTFGDMASETWRQREQVRAAAAQFDGALRSRLAPRVSPEFARLCELAYRQVMGAHTIAADFDGTMLMFSKENTSNGCIGTVDVIFPTAPFFLAINPDLLEANIRPVYAYACSPRWKFPFAPHDLGTFPKANGQVYGGGERTEENQMPVEECGNMIILTAALARAKPGWQPPKPWWDAMEQWAEYLGKEGLDPANQLCTDDFAGHLARNANLAVKAIVAVGAYGQMLRSTEYQADSDMRLNQATDMAADWHKLADAKDHTVLAYGQPQSWSLKYNMFWDRYLETGLFPPETRRREVAWYLGKIGAFGVPMDNRAEYTKPEWMVWSACLGEKRSELDRIVAPIVSFADKTPDRVPLSDWFNTTDARTRGMYARSVMGGIYAPMMLEPLPE